MKKRMFPIMPEYDPRLNPIFHPLEIPWDIAELAYKEYKRRFTNDQTLERIAARGGFSIGEMNLFLPDWKERLSAISSD